MSAYHYRHTILCNISPAVVRWDMGQPEENEGRANDWWSYGWSIKVCKECLEIIRERVSAGLIKPPLHRTQTCGHPHMHTYADSRERWDGRFRIIKQTEALVMKLWRLGVTRGTLQGSQPFPCWVFCSLNPPSQHHLPTFVFTGGQVSGGVVLHPCLSVHDL